MPGILLGKYRPPFPGGYPGVDYAVGRTSANQLNVASAQNLPASWTWAGPGNVVRMNGPATDWDFRGIDGFFGAQAPDVVLDQCLFDLSVRTWNNSPFMRVQAGAGTYFSVKNSTIDGLNATAGPTVCIGGSCILAEKLLIRNWPLDIINPSPLALRLNSQAYSLNAGISVVSKPNLNFFCTTAGTTAGSEPAGYASATHGATVTDGTAVFTASNVSNKVRYNRLHSSSSAVGGNHTDGMQVTAWASGAKLEVYENVIDISNPLSSDVTAPLNFSSGGGTSFASDVDIRDNELSGGSFSIYCDGVGDGITTGAFSIVRQYVRGSAFGALYNVNKVMPSLVMNNIKNADTGAALTFSYNNGTTTTTVSSIP